MTREIDVQKCFVEGKFGKKFVYLGHEVFLYDAYAMLHREVYEIFKRLPSRLVVGKIDIIFRYKSTNFIGEIKYHERSSAGNFWDALKVIGYLELYKWQEGKNNFKSAIIMPLKKVKLEHQIIAGNLGIKIFGIKELGDKYEIVDVLSKPIWKQLS